MAPFDAVVVGAGHNGLVCGAYLARAGLKVCIVERSDRIGGACVTEELFPGFLMSTAAYTVSLLSPEIIEELGLNVDIRVNDPMVFAPRDDGRGLLLWRDEKARADEIAKVSTADADAYPRFEALMDEAARRLETLLSFPATRKQARREFRRSEVEGLFDLTVDGTIAGLCEQYFESDAMQGLIASQGVIGTSAGPRTPGSAYVYLHHAWGRATGARGVWGSVRGGMGAITEELARVAREAGAEIRLEAPVESLKLTGRRVVGVVLESAEEIEAPIVMSNADPQRSAALVESGALPPEFMDDIATLPIEGTVVKVNCALGGLPRFTGMTEDGTVGPEHVGTITVAPSIGYLEDACRAAAEGRPADDFFCEAWIQTATEEGMSPPGKHTLSIFAQYAPYTLAEGDWESRREEIGDRVVASLERYAPGLVDLIEDRQVLGPRDLEARFGLTGGNIFHGEILPDWLFDKRPASPWHRYRFPIPGYYLCGSGAHPGGGVSGVPGRNAARAALSDLVARGVRVGA
jgi:phytoene dehydrogenase-like protein